MKYSPTELIRQDLPMLQRWFCQSSGMAKMNGEEMGAFELLASDKSLDLLASTDKYEKHIITQAVAGDAYSVDESKVVMTITLESGIFPEGK